MTLIQLQMMKMTFLCNISYQTADLLFNVEIFSLFIRYVRNLQSIGNTFDLVLIFSGNLY